MPTRAGRLNLGPWFGWWGFDAARGPAFDTVITQVAHLSVSPQAGAGFFFPQTYDQRYVAEGGDVAEAVCDFRDFYTQGKPPQPPVTCTCADVAGMGCCAACTCADVAGKGCCKPAAGCGNQVQPWKVAAIVLGVLFVVAVLSLAIPLGLMKTRQ